MNIGEEVGSTIRKYRFAYKMTLEELAARIHKNKSTMSKYEKGNISLDLDTLEELAGVFKIPVSQLVASASSSREAAQGALTFVDKQYMYSFDGRSRRVFKSVLEHYETETPGYLKANLFYDVQNLENWGDCKALYAGHKKKYEFIENYTLQNQNNPMEQVLICCLNSLGKTHKRVGLLSGLSYKTMLPVSIKVIISPRILKEDEELISSLLLTKEDIRISKKHNLFTIDQFLD